MTQCDPKQLLVLSAQADHLARLLERKRISKTEYIGKLNELRRQCELPPLATATKAITRG